jgi:polysaccharide export outer membrane protein
VVSLSASGIIQAFYLAIATLLGGPHRPVKVRSLVAVVSILAFFPGLAGAQQKPASEPPAVETINQTNQKIRLLANTAPLQSSEYVLGPGDMIKIDVFDIPELSRQIRIDPGGNVSIPLIPQRIRAAGLTPFQLESKIAELLEARGLVSHPQVSVFVVERRSQPITVIGAVERPMVYQAVGPTTLLQVLSAAGGLTDTAADFVMITHNGKDKSEASEVQRVNLRDLIDRGDPKANIELKGGDVVSVPKAGIVYVVGAVNRPGGFVIQNDTNEMTALKALALAGGMKEAAKPKDAVIIRKNLTSGSQKEIVVNLRSILSRKTEDVRLLPNDIFFIPESGGKKALMKAAEAALSITSGIVILRGAH